MYLQRFQTLNDIITFSLYIIYEKYQNFSAII